MCKLVKVQVVQNVAIYKNGELVMYAKGSASDVKEKLNDYYESIITEPIEELKHMLISSNSEFWESDIGSLDKMPYLLKTLQSKLDPEWDVIEPLEYREFIKTEHAETCDFSHERSMFFNLEKKKNIL